ncbi:MAG: HEPN domain-containing protein [Nanoarchaeota archaeon]|nr:HEPN domain-containing protein [Nanoarchaeota archaeon]
MDEEIKEKVFQQMMSLWVEPEINKRKSLDRLPKDFNLRAAQVIFSLDRGWNKVRLNDEVKAEAKVKLNASKNKGDPIYEQEIEHIESIKLTNEDPNCAHLTLLRIKDKWILSFDFTYNQKRIKEHIEAAKEFLDSAKDNLVKNRLRPFFENSFACSELLAKSILLQLPNKKILYGTNHDERINEFKNWAVLGNVEIKHSALLERLNSLRPSARYLCSTEFKEEDILKIIKNLEELMQFAERIVNSK